MLKLKLFYAGTNSGKNEKKTEKKETLQQLSFNFHTVFQWITEKKRKKRKIPTSFAADGEQPNITKPNTNKSIITTNLKLTYALHHSLDRRPQLTAVLPQDREGNSDDDAC